MKSFIRIILALLCVFCFCSAQAQETDKPDDGASVKVEKSTSETKADTKADKNLPPDLITNQGPQKKSLSKSDEKEFFDSERYETIDVELKYKPNPAADAVFVFFNYLSMVAIVAMIIFVSLWFLKNKKAGSGSSKSSGKKRASATESQKTDEKQVESKEEEDKEKKEEKEEDA